MLELANYLDMPRVLDGACASIAHRLHASIPEGMTVSEAEETELEEEYKMEVELSVNNS